MTEKIRISSVAKKYAQALIEIAKELGKADYFKNQFDELLDVFNSSKDLDIIMKNSSISISKKFEIIEEIFNEKIDIKLMNFIKILIEKNRFNLLEEIHYEYLENIRKILNIKTVIITSPIELGLENKSNVLFKLQNKLNCEVQPVWLVDKSLIAGLEFKFDDCVIDTSVKTKLENLSKSIKR